MSVRFTPRALAEAKRIKTWWQKNRRAAPDAFEEELSAALDRIVRAPGSGRLYEEGNLDVAVRRVLLPKTLNNVYYGKADVFARYAEAAEVMRRCDETMRSLNITSYQFSWASFIAELLLAAGKPDEAANVWPAPFPCRCRDPIDYAAAYPSLAIFRARAMEKLGRPGDAIRELDGVIAFWKEADADLPLLVEAKAMRKRLASAPAPGGPRPTAAQGEARPFRKMNLPVD